MFDHGCWRNSQSLPNPCSVNKGGQPEGGLSGMFAQAEAQIGPVPVGADQFGRRLLQLQELRA